MPVRDEFRKRGILAGRRFDPMDTWLRVSVGSEENIRAFVAAFKEIFPAQSSGFPAQPGSHKYEIFLVQEKRGQKTTLSPLPDAEIQLSYYIKTSYLGPTPIASSGLTKSQAMEPSTARADATRNDAVQPKASPIIGVTKAVMAPPI